MEDDSILVNKKRVDRLKVSELMDMGWRCCQEKNLNGS
jgi:hypothetical protein